MRYVKRAEQKQRGCEWCIDTQRTYKRIKTTGKMNIRMSCIHDKCPYHELDNVKTYSEYLNTYGNDTVSDLLRAILKSEEGERFVTFCD